MIHLAARRRQTTKGVVISAATYCGQLALCDSVEPAVAKNVGAHTCAECHRLFLEDPQRTRGFLERPGRTAWERLLGEGL